VLKPVSECCQVHRHRFSYLSCACVSSSLCSGHVSPASMSINIEFLLFCAMCPQGRLVPVVAKSMFPLWTGEIAPSWAGEAGPHCGGEVGSHCAKCMGSLVPVVVGKWVPVVPGIQVPVGPAKPGPHCGRKVGSNCGRETGPGWAWGVGPGFQGKPGLVHELWPGRPVPAEALGALVRFVVGALVMVEARKQVLVSRGSRDLSLSCSWGRPVPVVAGAPVPVEAEALVPVEAGILVPVKARRLVLVSRGSRGLYLCCTWGGWSRLMLWYWSRLRLGQWSRLRLGHCPGFPWKPGPPPIRHKQWTPRPGRELPLLKCLN
jgi:hypothetical protein